VVLNAANETAVARFLEGRISFLSIPFVIEKAMAAHRPEEVATIAAVRKVDEWAREYSQEIARAVELKV
jgi:1-deoxy-D-xylulose-5-phosphate reductoisomerase